MDDLVKYTLYDIDGRVYEAFVPPREVNLLDLCKYPDTSWVMKAVQVWLALGLQCDFWALLPVR